MSNYYGSVAGIKRNMPKLADKIKPDGPNSPHLGPLDIPESHIEQTLIEYSGRVDAILASRYDVPFVAVPAEIESITQDLAAYKIATQFLTGITAEQNQNFLAIRKDAMELLQQIANGSVTLPGYGEKPATPSTFDSDLEEIKSGSTGEFFDHGDPAAWQTKI